MTSKAQAAADAAAADAAAADPAADHLPAAAALSAEDAKLVTLARGAMGRAGAAQGAAVRDDDGRTYAAAAVSLPSLTLTAVQAAVVLAVSSATTALEAAVLVVPAGRSGTAVAGLDEPTLAVLGDLQTPVVLVTDVGGELLERRLL